MGQQQMILIVLSVVLVGIAIAIGIEMFNQNERNSQMDTIAWQLNDSAMQAYQYFIKPDAMGGASRDMAEVLADSLSWQPELMYAQNVSLDGDGSRLILKPRHLTVEKATLVLDSSGDRTLTWEDVN